MSEYSDIRVDAPRAGALRIRLHRPEVRNAYRSQTCAELCEAIAHFAADDDLRVLVLTGSEGTFCAGGDLKDPQAHEDARAQWGHGRVLRTGIHAVLRALQSLDKPVIAAVDGAAIAGGLALALACHLRIASRRARVGDVSTRAGLIPDDGGAWLFPRAMGLDRALRMTLLSEIYGADEALALGLVTEVVDDDAFEARVDAVVERLAAAAPLATRATIRLMGRSLDGSLCSTSPETGSRCSRPARSPRTGSTRSPSTRWPRRGSTSPAAPRGCSPSTPSASPMS